MDPVKDDVKISNDININTNTGNNTPSMENKASNEGLNIHSSTISTTLLNRRHIRKCSNQFIDRTKLHIDVDGKFDYSCDVFFQLLTIIQEKFALFHSDDLILVNGSVKCYKIVRSELYSELYKRRGYLYYADVDKLKFACYQMLFKINNGHVYNYQVKNNLLHFISTCLEYFPTRNITINEQKQKQKQKQKQINSSIVLLNDKIKRKDYLSKVQSDDYLININCQINEFMAKIYERFQLLQESSENNIIKNDKNNENENGENENNVKNTTEKINVTSNNTPEKKKELLERDFKSIRRTRNQNKNEVIKIDEFKQNHQNEMKLLKPESKTKQRIKKNDNISENNKTQVNDRKILPTTSAKKKIQHFKQTHNLENMHNFTTGQFHQIIGNESCEYYEALHNFMNCLHSSINKSNPISHKIEVETLIN